MPASNRTRRRSPVRTNVVRVFEERLGRALRRAVRVYEEHPDLVDNVLVLVADDLGCTVAALAPYQVLIRRLFAEMGFS